MKVLLIGDIVGRPGRDAVTRLVPTLRRTQGIQWVIANAENAAGGSGVTPAIAEELFAAQVDVLTSGNHIWAKREGVELLSRERRLLRPINYPNGVPGAGAAVYDTAAGVAVGVINVMGRVFMDVCDCPFRTVEQAVADLRRRTPVVFVDVHAEATSEKIAMGYFLDGKVSAVFGTHTHVQTADERVLPKGTAYITDLGMTGPQDSVIGRKTEQVLQRFLTHMPLRFEVAEGNAQLHGAIVELDEASGRATAIRRIQERLPEGA